MNQWQNDMTNFTMIEKNMNNLFLKIIFNFSSLLIFWGDIIIFPIVEIIKVACK